MRTPLVVGNWKMHGTLAEARPLATAVRDGLRRVKGAEAAVCPPFTALAAVSEILAGSPIALGAQNCHHEPFGPHTGEISPAMLQELGCRFVIVGHSERRREMGETDEQVNRKATAALAHGLTPILCVGETGDERRQGLTFTTVEGQLRAGLSGLEASAIAGVVLAYEPVWAIGTGDTATPEIAQQAHAFVRQTLRELAGEPFAAATRILYGGSANPANAASLIAQPDIDGFLVGGASLDPERFLAIIRTCGA